MKRYKEFFRKDCTLEEEAKGVCACDKNKDEEDEIKEDCPYKPAGGGSCASADNNSKLKGKCQNGYQWSSDKEQCFKVADTKK
jgi:hypothetical protein